LRRAWLAAAGAAIAVVGALCGIGGGLFAVPILHFAAKLDLRRAVASGLLLVLATALSATVTEALRPDSWLRFDLLAVLVPTALVGTQLGYTVSRRISTTWLRALFVVVLVYAGWRMLTLGGGGVAESAAAVEEWGASRYALLAAIGVAGGFVTPLLGVGGGLVLVPALFLGVPDLGFALARSASLAVAVFTATRSLWLYSREGLVEWRAASPLALGALLGAAVGVFLVHEPGWVDVARKLLACVLWVVGLRFARDLVRARRTA
jgi:hypothetical protein